MLVIVARQHNRHLGGARGVQDRGRQASIDRKTVDQIRAEICDELRHAGAGVAIVDDTGHTAGFGEQATTGIMRHAGEIAALRDVQPVFGAGEARERVAIGLKHSTDLMIENVCTTLNGVIVIGEKDAHRFSSSEAKQEALKKQKANNC